MNNRCSPLFVDVELEIIFIGDGLPQGVEVLQKRGQDSVCPPQIDSGIEVRDGPPCILKDLIWGFLHHGVDPLDLFPLHGGAPIFVAVSYHELLDASQVGLQVVPVKGTAWLGILGCFQFDIVGLAGDPIFSETGVSGLSITGRSWCIPVAQSISPAMMILSPAIFTETTLWNVLRGRRVATVEPVHSSPKQ